MRTRIAFMLGLALCVAAPGVQAHEGHSHPPAKTRKVKKPKAPKKAEACFTVADVAAKHLRRNAQFSALF